MLTQGGGMGILRLLQLPTNFGISFRFNFHVIKKLALGWSRATHAVSTPSLDTDFPGRD